MSNDMVRLEDFGKDLGVVHEAVVTGRKVGAGRDFWSALAHQENLFTEVVNLVHTKLGLNQQPDDFIDLIVDWQNFYREVFQQEVNLSGIIIPKRKKGFDRLLVLIPGMTPRRLFDKCKELFHVWVWTNDDLDKIVVSDRTAQNGAYAVWVRDRVEADSEHKNKSASNLKQKKISGITLEERFIYELKYFKETGKHLDIDNVTLCSGSRYYDGYVPGVYWDSYDDKLLVFWYGLDIAFDYLRAREVVSWSFSLYLFSCSLDGFSKAEPVFFFGFKFYDTIKLANTTGSD